MEAADQHRMSPMMISSPPPKRSAQPSKAKLNARRIRIPNARWLGWPGSPLVSADGIATTNRPVQRPCAPAGLSSPTGPKAIVLQWLCKMCESRSPPGEGKKALRRRRCFICDCPLQGRVSKGCGNRSLAEQAVAFQNLVGFGLDGLQGGVDRLVVV